jgi:hypothetical protein
MLPDMRRHAVPVDMAQPATGSAGR